MLICSTKSDYGLEGELEGVTKYPSGKYKLIQILFFSV